MEKKLFVVFTSLLLFCGGVFAQKKIEYTVRANMVLQDGSVNATAGALLNENVVLGIGSGWGQLFRPQGPGGSRIGQRLTFYAYNRLYFPLGNKRKVFLYSDQLLGGLWLYKIEPFHEKSGKLTYDKPLQWYYSWQPGVAFRIRGESNVFLGISLGPTFGLHAGLTF